MQCTRCSLPPALLAALAVLAGTVAGQGTGPVPASPPTAAALRSMLDSLTHPNPSPDHVLAVHDLTLRRDAIELQLQDGFVFWGTPIGGRIVSAGFIGSGLLSVLPPPGVERTELRRVLRDTVVHAPITAAWLLFADSTPLELAHRSGAPSPAQGPVASAFERLHGWTPDLDLPADFEMAVVNGVTSGFFYARVKRVDGEDLMVQLDPEDPEPVAVLRGGKLQGQKSQIVSQFGTAEELADTTGGDSVRDFLKLEGYRIESSFNGGLDLRGQTTLRLTARQAAMRWVQLDLYSELTADSVADDSAPADAFDVEKSSEALWVRFGAAVQPGETRALRVSYHGHIVGRGSMIRAALPAGVTGLLDNWTYIKTPYSWFPRYPSRQTATVDLLFHVPKQFQLASIGKLQDSQVVGDVSTTHWVSERPADQICFNIGEFEERQITDPRIPPVTVQMNSEAHRRLDQAGFGRADIREVGDDVANSLSFFTRVYGAPLFSHYFATEIPGSYGEAFPGLMYYSMLTFASEDQSGFQEVFRAHEMAHQWWGIGVEPAGTRDAWLSEGFADFSGLWYMQLILNDNTKFFKLLDDYRRDIQARRRDAPPIALGGRIDQTDTPDDYDLIVYKKGAWVLQMLRNLMIDFHTMKEDAFIAMMQDFYAQYRGRRASTRDFERLVERHFGMSMDWFFDEWVRGTAIPKYTLSWKSDSMPDRHIVLHLRVRQEDVPAGFIMPVPVRLKFASGGEAIVRITVHGPVTEGTLPVPESLSGVELNPLGSVLADIKTEGWH